MGDVDYIMVDNFEEAFWDVKPVEDTLGLSDIYCRGEIIAYDMDTPLANHIVELHNSMWSEIIWASYSQNIMLSSVTEFYGDSRVPLPAGVASS